jgi:hypothetical protein
MTLHMAKVASDPQGEATRSAVDPGLSLPCRNCTPKLVTREPTPELWPKSSSAIAG